MTKLLLALGVATCALSTSLAQTPPAPAPSPGEIVAAAPASDWTAIAPADLLVMDLAPGPRGARRVVIQLMPAPFSQGWVNNIRLFARSGWYDGISVNRVQDNYVTQWGDPNYDNPEATGKTKPLPEGLKVIAEKEYIVAQNTPEYAALRNAMLVSFIRLFPKDHQDILIDKQGQVAASQLNQFPSLFRINDSYSDGAYWTDGWPVSFTVDGVSPTHCYGMVGVGRNLSPDTGSGPELYTVIGHAPRHLDRNIALVGRVIEGIEHLSSLPRGTGALGFYEQDEERVPILSVRIGTEIAELPAFEYLSTESATFAQYADSRANRRDPFFNVAAGGADICNIPVPVRRKVVP